jgi:hypothetical protein
LKLSNSESGCEVAVLQLMLNQRQPTVSCRSAKKRTCAFQLFIPFQTSVSLLETERLFRIVFPRADS